VSSHIEMTVYSQISYYNRSTTANLHDENDQLDATTFDFDPE